MRQLHNHVSFQHPEFDFSKKNCNFDNFFIFLTEVRSSPQTNRARPGGGGIRGELDNLFGGSRTGLNNNRYGS